MKTEIFNSYDEFLEREDKSVNGITPEVAARFTNWREDTQNIGCWLCHDNCSNCHNCHVCRDCFRCVSCDNCKNCYDCNFCNLCSQCEKCLRCSNCHRCDNCVDCCLHVRCKDIPQGSISACFIGIYDYVCSPRIHPDGEQMIQMGCKLFSRAEWEKDPWNNPIEFPNDGSESSENRMLALRMAYMWLDEKMKTRK